jgi:aryl-alcohol dehydrogenase-like predicted oxidoreductase
MKLGLGTAQFGMDYGITNADGRVPAHEVDAILQLAAAHDMEVVDTAPAYGDSESVLGARLLRGHRFKLMTKTLPLRMRGRTESVAAFVRSAFMRSLERLRQPAVYGLLVHDAEDLRGPEAEDLIGILFSLRNERLVGKIGASVYSGEQIDAALALDVADIVQLPLNVLDQRLLASGHLSKLKEHGAEIHARSLFLQGLLLAPPAAVPEHLAGARAPLERFTSWTASEHMTPAAAALAFAEQLDLVDHAIVGAISTAQLDELLRAHRHTSDGARRFSGLACDDLRVIDPSRWPTKAAGR